MGTLAEDYKPFKIRILWGIWPTVNMDGPITARHVTMGQAMWFLNFFYYVTIINLFTDIAEYDTPVLTSVITMLPLHLLPSSFSFFSIKLVIFPILPMNVDEWMCANTMNEWMCLKITI